MADISYEQEILDQISKLSSEEQRRVLEFARSLSRPRGEAGWKLVEHAREIDFPPEDLAEIAKAVRDCEEIDFDEWDLSS